MVKLGYLLPTRERIMEGQPETASLLALAERAEALGFDSVWVGDSLLARPRHDPLTLLAAVAARTKRVELGTAVLLPALRNPVVLAQQVATLDRIAEGRVILGIGIASDLPNIRAEFEAAGVPFDKRVGRLVEGCGTLPGAVERQAGGLASSRKRRALDGRVERAGPDAASAGRAPIWIGGAVTAARERTGRLFDGWFPNAPSPSEYAVQWAEVQQAARAAARDPATLTAAMYLTLAIDDDAARADAKINSYLENYYGTRPDVMRKRQMCYAGPDRGRRGLAQGLCRCRRQPYVLALRGRPRAADGGGGTRPQRVRPLGPLPEDAL